MLSHTHNMPQMVVVNYEIYVALNRRIRIRESNMEWDCCFWNWKVEIGMLEITVSNVKHDKMVWNLVHLEVKRRFRHVLDLSCQQPQHQKWQSELESLSRFAKNALMIFTCEPLSNNAWHLCFFFSSIIMCTIAVESMILSGLST